MVVKHILMAGLCATASFAFAGPMQSPGHGKGAASVDGAPTNGHHHGGVFTHGPDDTSSLGNGGVTGGPSAPPPFTNVLPGRGRPDALPPSGPTEIPEPAGGALILAGLMAAGFASRRRRK